MMHIKFNVHIEWMKKKYLLGSSLQVITGLNSHYHPSNYPTEPDVWFSDSVSKLDDRPQMYWANL